MWHGITAEGEAEYNQWHTREHMPERLAIPGSLVGRRSVDWSLDRHRYFTSYAGRTLEVFRSEAYLARLNAPTAWSERIQPHFRNFIRAACETVHTSGRGIGGALATVRVDFAEGGEAGFAASAPEVDNQYDPGAGRQRMRCPILERMFCTGSAVALSNPAAGGRASWSGCATSRAHRT